MKKPAPFLKRALNWLNGELFGRWVVSVQWENISKKHYGFSRLDAMEWADCYPEDAKIEIVYFPVFAQPRTIDA